ncbi:MAG TPA: hypothetical protein VIL95_07625 [Bacillota bacterium]
MLSWVADVATSAGFNEDELRVLGKNVMLLTTKERRAYRRLRDRLPRLAARLQAEVERRRRREADFLERLATHSALRVISAGYLSIVETLLLEAVGRHEVTRRLEKLKAADRRPRFG